MVHRKIYLDVCCLCRPFDDQTVHRIRMETEAVARGYHRYGLEPFDALHLACAGSVGAVFLTTDDSLIKSIKRHEDKITTGVYNPVQWLMEVTMDGSEDVE